MSTAVVIHEPHAIAPAARAQLSLLKPIAAPAEIIEAQEATRELVAKALKSGRDYGKVPGTEKDTLLKPGAERVALAFGCYYGEPEIVEKEIDHDRIVEWVKRKKAWRNQFKGDREFTWNEERGTSIGLYRYVLRIPVIERSSGVVVGYGIGSCSTMEAKYVLSPRDSENTVFKMAHKRAIVGGCLVTFGLSDQFTQDVEDLPQFAEENGEPAKVSDEPAAPCPKCKGAMHDNRTSKTNPKAPDFKCKDKSCDGVYWPGQWPPVEKSLANEVQIGRLMEIARDERVKLSTRTKINEALQKDGITRERALKWIDAYDEKYGAAKEQPAGDAEPGEPAASTRVDAGELEVRTSAASSEGSPSVRPPLAMKSDLVDAMRDDLLRAKDKEAKPPSGAKRAVSMGGEGVIPE